VADINWSLIFDNWGIKAVTPTDKSKSAYVVTTEQGKAIKGAGVKPSLKRPAKPFNVVTPLDPFHPTVVASFYCSVRSDEADREPEARMGRELISKWLQKKEDVLIGNIGYTLCAIKLESVKGLTTEEVMQKLAHKLPAPTVLALAKKAPVKPEKKTVERSAFVRNPYVVAAAIHRAKNACEMPGCSAELFERDDGSAYLEVHHVIPLGEKGADSLDNVAALCPRCHREQHHSKDRDILRKKLKRHIKSLLRP